MQPPPIQISAHTSKCWPRLVSIMIILFHKVKFIACGIIAEKCICAVSVNEELSKARQIYNIAQSVVQKGSEYLSGNHGKLEVAGDRDMFYVNAIKLPRLICYVLHFKNQNND